MSYIHILSLVYLTKRVIIFYILLESRIIPKSSLKLIIKENNRYRENRNDKLKMFDIGYELLVFTLKNNYNEKGKH